MRMKLNETNDFGGEHIIKRSQSIFNAIKSLASNPFEWLDQANADLLDVEYYMNHSGQKTISPMFVILNKVNTNESGVIDIASSIQEIAKIIASKFKDKWNKLYEAFIESDYKPLENYSMEQTETPNVTRHNIEKTKTKIETETTDDKTESSVYGFNSATPVPSGEATRNGVVTVSGDDTDNVVDNVNTETGTRKLDRHGNIGVTTSQQMLQSEIDLRTNYNFVEMLFKDVDSVMTLSIY